MCLGFLPDYLRRIAWLLGTHYSTRVFVEWRFYTTGAACTSAVIEGEADMTDIYFLQGLPEMVSSSPVSLDSSRGSRMLRRFYRTCPAVAASIVFVCREDLKVNSLKDISQYIRRQPTRPVVAYLTPANQQSMHFFLPPDTPHLITESQAHYT